jgi:hypothetical protein
LSENHHKKEREKVYYNIKGDNKQKYNICVVRVKRENNTHTPNHSEEKRKKEKRKESPYRQYNLY